MNDLFAVIIVVIALGSPIVLSVLNILGCVLPGMNKKVKLISWLVTAALGSFLSFIYMILPGTVLFDAEWSEQLYNSEIHQPFWSDSIHVYLAMGIIALIGFCILVLRQLRNTPPLLVVLSIASMYPFAVACIIWCIQLSTRRQGILLMVLPVNLLIIMCSLICEKIREWNAMEEHQDTHYGKNKIIRMMNQWLCKAGLWPLWAFFLAIPLLGIFLGILMLFGQQPDLLIKAWTETAEWRLSARTAPPNLYYDEHYLCTVAAGGHEKIVRPLRMGERHGHRVVVNRQLEIANAFEQILEERTPGFHKVVRGVYDKYGFPVARCIRTKSSCDMVYVLMKPLEWLFLMVLYLTDVKPEDRIAVQYMPGYRQFMQ